MDLIDDPKRIIEQKKKSRHWVIKNHNLHNTADVLYGYYQGHGIV